MPLWFRIAAALGLVWNVFGTVQFINSLSATAESLQAQGLSPDQAAVMLGYPAWMTVVFAILCVVVLIAAALLWLAVMIRARGALTR